MKYDGLSKGLQKYMDGHKDLQKLPPPPFCPPGYRKGPLPKNYGGALIRGIHLLGIIYYTEYTEQYSRTSLRGIVFKAMPTFEALNKI